MPQYDLPIWAHDLDEFPLRGIAGKGWRLGARQVRFQDNDEKEDHFLKMRAKYPRYSICYIDEIGHEHSRVAPQIFVEARNRIIAQRVCDLVRAALCVIDGSNVSDPGELLAVPNDRTNLEDVDRATLMGSGSTLGRGGVLLAARLAATCSQRKPCQYALLKLNQSFELASTHWIDLDPAHAEKYFGVVSDRKAHVAMATAATLGYSAIEELQLEPKPVGQIRDVKVKKAWNPEALADLTGRLEKAGIDLRCGIHWTVRGSPTRIHKSTRAPEGDKEPYSRGLVRTRQSQFRTPWLRPAGFVASARPIATGAKQSRLQCLTFIMFSSWRDD